MGCGESENKPSCLECANTDRFKDQRSVWVNKNMNSGGGTSKGETQLAEKDNGKSVNRSIMGEKRNDPTVEELPGCQVNVATRKADVSDISRGWMRVGTKIGPKSVLSLSTPDSVEWGCVVLLVSENIYHT